MAFNDTNINICSRALSKIGAESISSFDEGTTEAKVASQLYETSKQMLLSAYPWTFNKSEVYLARINNTSLAKYKYLYEKPIDYLTARTLKENDCVVDYCFINSKINTDAEKPILVYSSITDENDMPPYFISLLIDYLACQFLIPVTGKNEDYKIFNNIYKENLAEAKSLDARSKTPSFIDTNLLIGLR